MILYENKAGCKIFMVKKNFPVNADISLKSNLCGGGGVYAWPFSVQTQLSFC